MFGKTGEWDNCTYENHVYQGINSSTHVPASVLPCLSRLKNDKYPLGKQYAVPHFLGVNLGNTLTQFLATPSAEKKPMKKVESGGGPDEYPIQRGSEKLLNVKELVEPEAVGTHIFGRI